MDFSDTDSSFEDDEFEDDPTLVEFLKAWIDDNEDLFMPEIKKTRRRGRRFNYWDSEWGRLLLDPTIMDPKSPQGLKFRRRFRVPFPLFIEVIIPLCKERNIFDIKDERKV